MSKRKRVSQKTKAKISKGLNKFWDKKGRKKEDKEKSNKARNIALAGLGIGAAGLGAAALLRRKKAASGATTIEVEPSISGATTIEVEPSITGFSPKALLKGRHNPASSKPLNKRTGKFADQPKPPKAPTRTGQGSLVDKGKGKGTVSNAAFLDDGGTTKKIVVDPEKLGDTRGLEKSQKSTKLANQRGGKDKTKVQSPEEKRLKRLLKKAKTEDQKQEIQAKLDRATGMRSGQSFVNRESLKKAQTPPATRAERNLRRRRILQSDKVREARRKLSTAKTEAQRRLFEKELDKQKKERKGRVTAAQKRGTYFKKQSNNIEFARKSAKEKAAISRGLKKFWSKKGKKVEKEKGKKGMSTKAKITLGLAGVGGIAAGVSLLRRRKRSVDLPTKELGNKSFKSTYEKTSLIKPVETKTIKPVETKALKPAKTRVSKKRIPPKNQKERFARRDALLGERAKKIKAINQTIKSLPSVPAAEIRKKALIKSRKDLQNKQKRSIRDARKRGTFFSKY